MSSSFIIKAKKTVKNILGMETRILVRDLPLSAREKEVTSLYLEKTGKTVNLENPQTFNEKVQWYKLYYRDKQLSRIVDKVAFKDYIKEKLGDGYTVPLIGCWNRVEDINWDSLPESFVLKSNISCDGNDIIIVRDKSQVDVAELKKKLRDWLDPYKLLLNSTCSAYYESKPMILCENYIEQINGEVFDYKFYCFNGKCYCTYVATGHFKEKYLISFYDENWKRIDVKYGHYEQNLVDAPKNFKKMIEISEMLSKDFPFVRVDFFEIESKLLLSEMTFYPGGGYNEFVPDKFDYELGELFVLPRKTNVNRKNTGESI